MKTAEEYLPESDLAFEGGIELFLKSKVVALIEQAQKEAYNAALIDAAMLGKVEHAMVQSGDHPVYEYRIDKRSILRLKKEL